MKISKIKTNSTNFSSNKKISHLQKPATKQIYKEIVFKPAKTMDEAKNFAYINFGIEEFYFEDDLEMANYVNEGLANIKNKFHGKVFMPKRVGFGELDNLDDEHAFCDIKGEGFYIIKEAYDEEKIMEELEEVTKRALKNLDKINIAKFARFKDKYDTMLQNPNSYSKIEWQSLLQMFDDVISDLVISEKYYDELPYRYISIFDTIYHEMGHIQQIKNSSKFSRTLGKLSPLNLNFQQNRNTQKIAQKVSWYAQSSPQEFVAEVFVLLCNGRKIDDDVLNLYKYYNGLI